MQIAPSALTSLSDSELLVEVARLAHAERTATVQLIAALAEIDARRLYLGEGCGSLYAYCTGVLRLSEHAAYGRIAAARTSRRFPVVLEMLQRGELTLTSVCLLDAHLTEANCRDVLTRARHRSKREVEELVASLRPRPDVPPKIRKLPTPSAPMPLLTAAPVTASPPVPTTAIESPKPALVQPLAPERYKIQLTVSRETRDTLRRVQDLMRHSIPDGDLAIIFDRALALLLADLERQKCAAASRPRTTTTNTNGSRHIPAAVRRAVWKRDEGRCAFKGVRGRCCETAILEFHHVRPFADGGEATVENIELRCRAHNQYEARLYFGEEFTVRECYLKFGARTSPIISTRSGPSSSRV
jgi:5-methylcytosine-specific restriction endonuclease McrA